MRINGKLKKGETKIQKRKENKIKWNKNEGANKFLKTKEKGQKSTFCGTRIKGEYISEMQRMNRKWEKIGWRIRTSRQEEKERLNDSGRNYIVHAEFS